MHRGRSGRRLLLLLQLGLLLLQGCGGSSERRLHLLLQGDRRVRGCRQGVLLLLTIALWLRLRLRRLLLLLLLAAPPRCALLLSLLWWLRLRLPAGRCLLLRGAAAIRAGL